MKLALRTPLLLLFVLLAACSGNAQISSLPSGERAYAIAPPPDPNAPPASYVIVPNDVLDLKVFQEPDLSNDKMQVDNVGNIQMPLIGELAAAGRTSTELAEDIARRLGARYIVNPQVVVSITKQAARFVTVEGEVEKPGVYELEREDTLLSAIARAQSPTKEAALDQIVVFRTIDGRRMAARFNLNQIRTGGAPDPEMQAGDAVVVGFSGLKGAWRDILQAAPIFNTFTFLISRNTI